MFWVRSSWTLSRWARISRSAWAASRGQDGVHNIAVGHDRVLHVLLHLEGLAAEGLHSLAHMAVDLDHQCVPAALHDGAVELLVQAADHSRVPLLNGA